MQVHELFQTSHDLSIAPILNTPRQRVKWHPPCAPSVMINWDATTCTKTNKIGLGVVVRNHTGSMLAYVSSTVTSVGSNPLTEEAMLYGEAYSWAQSWGSQNLR